MDRVSFTCFKCNARVNAPISAVGSKGKCPQCKAVNIVPHPSTDESSDTSLIREVAQLMRGDIKDD